MFHVRGGILFVADPPPLRCGSPPFFSQFLASKNSLLSLPSCPGEQCWRLERGVLEGGWRLGLRVHGNQVSQRLLQNVHSGRLLLCTVLKATVVHPTTPWIFRLACFLERGLIVTCFFFKLLADVRLRRCNIPQSSIKVTFFPYRLRGLIFLEDAPDT